MKKIPFNKRGDHIQIELSDNTHNVYFKGKACVTNMPELSRLLFVLESKGIPIEKAITVSKKYTKDQWW